MGRRTKIVDKVKTIFGRQSSRARQPPENNVLPDMPISHGPLPGDGARNSGPDAPVDENRSMRTTQPTSSDHLDHRAGVHRAAAGNNQDGEWNASWGEPPMGHSPSKPIGFHNVKNSGISYGGGAVNVRNEFHNHNPSKRIRPGLALLKDRVATAAFHNSARRVDPPRCHPETRVAIQKQIYDWIVTDLLLRQTWILWMHGAAGAGKSAIMQSIAELCEQAHIPLASFFFFRTDATRNSTALFIATVVYQLIQRVPRVRDDIFTIIENDPLILEESLESQLQKLIVHPLVQLQAHFKCCFVVLIDGLDECLERAHQADLIKLLGTISRSRSTPVIFLVASRREPQIEAAFIHKQISDLVLILPLDNSDIEQTSDDIRRFLIDKFGEIKQNHRLKQYLPNDWPPASSVEEIVDKSSGQFIFASVVINSLSSPRTNPAHQLEVLRGIHPRAPSSQNPFAHLDALYNHIFSQVEALSKVLEITAYALLPEGSRYIQDIEFVFLLGPGEVDVLFADMAAIIRCEPPRTHPPAELKFLHASLPDFLVDNTRSGQYHIDLDGYRTTLLCKFLERCPPTSDPRSSGDGAMAVIFQEQSRLLAARNLLEKAKASERLRSAFMNFHYTIFSKMFLATGGYSVVPDILQLLKQLEFSDQGEAYRHVLDIFAAECAKCWSLLPHCSRNDVEEDLFSRIKHIQEQII